MSTDSRARQPTPATEFFRALTTERHPFTPIARDLIAPADAMSSVWLPRIVVRGRRRGGLRQARSGSGVIRVSLTALALRRGSVLSFRTSMTPRCGQVRAHGRFMRCPDVRCIDAGASSYAGKLAIPSPPRPKRQSDRRTLTGAALRRTLPPGPSGLRHGSRYTTLLLPRLSIARAGAGRMAQSAVHPRLADQVAGPPGHFSTAPCTAGQSMSPTRPRRPAARCRRRCGQFAKPPAEPDSGSSRRPPPCRRRAAGR
jgi:hypothetical protein